MAKLSQRSRLETEVLGEAGWQDRLDRLPGYSFFATPTWGRILSEAGLGYRSQALEFTLEGQRALLPLVSRDDRLGRTLHQSSAFGTYGGLVPLDGDADISSSQLGAEVARRFQATPRFGLLIAYPGPRPHFRMPAVFDRYEAHVIDLQNEPADRMLEAMRPKTRQYIRKAERDGVHVQSGESSESFHAYYRLLEASSRRWGRANPGKPWTLFDAIQRLCAEGDVRLWMAQVGDEPVAGLVCFYGKGEVFAWSAALDERYVATRANYLLHWRAIADAAGREFSVFNLGSNEGLAGVRWFKEGLGTHPREYPAYVVAGRAYTAAFWAWRKASSAVAALRSIKGLSR